MGHDVVLLEQGQHGLCHRGAQELLDHDLVALDLLVGLHRVLGHVLAVLLVEGHLVLAGDAALLLVDVLEPDLVAGGERLADGTAGLEVPHPHQVVVSARDGDRPAVEFGAGDGVDPVPVVPHRREHQPPGGQIPQPDERLSAPSCGERPAIPRDRRDRADRREPRGQLSPRHAPDPPRYARSR